MDIIIRVTSVKNTGKFRGTTAEYHVGKIPLPVEAVAQRAAWRFRKTLPEPADYTVVLMKDGTCTCDCPHGSYMDPSNPTVCVHISAVATLADCFKEISVEETPSIDDTIPTI